MSRVIQHARDLIPDRRNANRGTARGQKMLKKSLEQYGAGRSILADRNGVVIAGNKTLEAAAEMGLPVVVVETDGTELVVVQRTDLDLETDTAARELAYADNRTAQINLDFDPKILAEDLQTGIHLDDLFTEEEIDRLLEGLHDVDIAPSPLKATSGIAYTPDYAPETSTEFTQPEDIEKARRELEAKFRQQIALKPIVCPHCAREFYLDARTAIG